MRKTRVPFFFRSFYSYKGTPIVFFNSFVPENEHLLNGTVYYANENAPNEKKLAARIRLSPKMEILNGTMK